MHSCSITIILVVLAASLAVGSMASRAEDAGFDGHWWRYCRIAVGALAEIADDVATIGTRIIAIVPDRQQYARQLVS